MQSRSQNTQQPILLSTQKRYTALRKLTSESSTITSFAIADFPNQDFVAVFEKQINGRYYLGVAKYSAENEVVLPFSYITKNDQISNIETIDDTTSSLVLSSDAPMYATVTGFNDGGFIIACFQGQFLSVTAKTFDSTGYSKSIAVDNSGLGVFYPGSISIDQEAAARWAESVPRSLSLLSFPDKRFIITRAAQMTSITWDVIGLPPRFENPHKTSSVLYKNAYNSDASPSGSLTIEPPDDLEGHDVNFLTNTRMMLTDATQHKFTLMYYLTSQMQLIGKLCQFNPGTVAACGEGKPLFSEQIEGQRDAANLALYNKNNFMFPLFVYESRNFQWGNQQIFLSAYNTSSVLVSTNNQEGLYHDTDPTITMLSSGDIVITGHRYKVEDGTSFCLIMQILQASGTTLHSKYAAPYDQPWCFADNPDTYSINKYNAVNILDRTGSSVPFAEYWLNSSGYVIGFPVPLPNTNTLMSSSMNQPSHTYNIQYALLGAVSVIFLLFGMANLMRVFHREKLSNKNSDEADGLLAVAPKVELKYYGSGENSINRFTAYKPQLKQSSDNPNSFTRKV